MKSAFREVDRRRRLRPFRQRRHQHRVLRRAAPHGRDGLADLHPVALRVAALEEELESCAVKIPEGRLHPDGGVLLRLVDPPESDDLAGDEGPLALHRRCREDAFVLAVLDLAPPARVRLPFAGLRILALDAEVEERALVALGLDVQPDAVARLGEGAPPLGLGDAAARRRLGELELRAGLVALDGGLEGGHLAPRLALLVVARLDAELVRTLADALAFEDQLGLFARQVLLLVPVAIDEALAGKDERERRAGLERPRSHGLRQPRLQLDLLPSHLALPLAATLLHFMRAQ